MRMFFAAAAVALVAAGYSTTTFAQDRDEARCVALINQTQSRVGNSSQDRGAVQRELDAAYRALKEGGDRRACLAHAQRAADMVGGSGSSRAPDRYDDRRYDDRNDRRSDDRRNSGGLGDLIERTIGR